VAKIAYVKGSYDKIEDIILSLGYTATEITNNDLTNLNTIAQYDIIFLNCGSRKYSTNQALFLQSMQILLSSLLMAEVSMLQIGMFLI
jgi:hypothetical protein